MLSRIPFKRVNWINFLFIIAALGVIGAPPFISLNSGSIGLQAV